MYDDYLSADQRYQAARQTNESDHGWSFEPEPAPTGNASGFWIILIAVGLVVFGAAAALAAEVGL